MTIKDTRSDVLVKFKNVGVGDVFCYGGDFYLKLSSNFTVPNIFCFGYAGGLDRMGDENTLVEPVDSELIIK